MKGRRWLRIILLSGLLLVLTNFILREFHMNQLAPPPNIQNFRVRSFTVLPTFPLPDDSQGDLPGPGCHPLSSLLSNNTNASPFNWTGNSARGIPNLLHVFHETTSLPHDYVDLLKTCYNVNSHQMHFVLWTEMDVIKFLWRHFGSLKGKLYDKLLYPWERRDVSRYMILFHFGGMFMDLDYKCKRPLWPLLNVQGPVCLLDQEEPEQAQVTNDRPIVALHSAMACSRGHPFLWRVLSELTRSVLRRDNNDDTTGSLVLTNVYDIYRGKSPSQRVILLPHTVFSPFKTSDPHALQHLTKVCKSIADSRQTNPPLRAPHDFTNWRRKGCSTWSKADFQRTVNNTMKPPYMVHLFTQQGHDDSDAQKKRYSVDICTNKVAKDNKFYFYRF